MVRSSGPTATGRAPGSVLRRLRAAVSAVGAGLALLGPTMGCSVGAGEGYVGGSLVVAGCEEDLSRYQMEPRFFGAVAANHQLTIRLQRSGDLDEFSDVLVIAVTDTREIAKRLGEPIPVALERPPGSAPDVPYPLLRMSLSLRDSCGSGAWLPRDNPQVVLHAVEGSVVFTSILTDEPWSADTNEKRIAGSFENVRFVDPRAPSGSPEAHDNGGTLSGSFRFFYQRGGPAQPFP